VLGSSYVVQVAADAREAMRLRSEGEIALLRAQLNPHVLFNTLHSLLEMVRGNDDGAEEAIECFGRVVKYLSEHREVAAELVTLREEWRNASDYLALEGLRLGARLHVELDLDETAAGTQPPVATLQPLVENAITHGIAPRPGRGTLTMHATRIGETVYVEICDNGQAAMFPSVPGNGRGLSLVHARLQAHFGDAAHIHWGPQSVGAGWQVSIRVPA